MSESNAQDRKRRLEERIAQELSGGDWMSSELARNLNIHTGQACETLVELVRRGWVSQHENGRYSLTERYREQTQGRVPSAQASTGAGVTPPPANAKTIAAFFAEDPQHLAQVARHEIYQRRGRGQTLWALTPKLALVELAFTEPPDEEAMLRAQRNGYAPENKSTPLPGWRVTIGQKIQEFAVVEVRAPTEEKAYEQAMAGDVEKWIEDWHGDTTAEGSMEVIDSQALG